MSLGQGFDGVLGAAQQGSEWAWELLVRDLTGSLTGFFRARGAVDPDDLAGEVFFQIAAGIGTFEGSESGFRSWVFVIAYRRLVDDRRRRGRRPEAPAPFTALEGRHLVASAEDAALDRIGVDEAHGLMAQLTPDQRDVLTLRVVAGLSLEETATVVGKPVSAVKGLQRRGLAALRREMRKRGVSR